MAKVRYCLTATARQFNRPCSFCKETDDNELKYGVFYSIGRINVHHFCLLLSNKLSQNGKDNEGVLGFLHHDIMVELKRASHSNCFHCGHITATLVCAHPDCKKRFHLSCGIRHGALSIFTDTFQSYCINHRPTQRIPVHIFTSRPINSIGSPIVLLENINLKTNKKNTIHRRFSTILRKDTRKLLLPPRPIAPPTPYICGICLEEVIPMPSSDTFWPPCCRKDVWMHRICVAKQALSAGRHFIRCPLCNDQRRFLDALHKYGYYVPDQDASWEREEGAFSELHERPSSCYLPKCLCPRGRDFKGGKKWELIMCSTCGSQAAHKGCANITKKRLVCSRCIIENVTTENSANAIESNTESNIICKSDPHEDCCVERLPSEDEVIDISDDSFCQSTRNVTPDISTKNKIITLADDQICYIDESYLNSFKAPTQIVSKKKKKFPEFKIIRNKHPGNFFKVKLKKVSSRNLLKKYRGAKKKKIEAVKQEYKHNNKNEDLSEINPASDSLKSESLENEKSGSIWSKYSVLGDLYNSTITKRSDEDIKIPQVFNNTDNSLYNSKQINVSNYSPPNTSSEMFNVFSSSKENETSESPVAMPRKSVTVCFRDGKFILENNEKEVVQFKEFAGNANKRKISPRKNRESKKSKCSPSSMVNQRSGSSHERLVFGCEDGEEKLKDVQVSLVKKDSYSLHNNCEENLLLKRFLDDVEYEYENRRDCRNVITNCGKAIDSNVYMSTYKYASLIPSRDTGALNLDEMSLTNEEFGTKFPCVEENKNLHKFFAPKRRWSDGSGCQARNVVKMEPYISKANSICQENMLDVAFCSSEAGAHEDEELSLPVSCLLSPKLLDHYRKRLGELLYRNEQNSLNSTTLVKNTDILVKCEKFKSDGNSDDHDFNSQSKNRESFGSASEGDLKCPFVRLKEPSVSISESVSIRSKSRGSSESVRLFYESSSEGANNSVVKLNDFH